MVCENSMSEIPIATLEWPEGLLTKRCDAELLRTDVEMFGHFGHEDRE